MPRRFAVGDVVKCRNLADQEGTILCFYNGTANSDSEAGVQMHDPNFRGHDLAIAPGDEVFPITNGWFMPRTHLMLVTPSENRIECNSYYEEPEEEENWEPEVEEYEEEEEPIFIPDEYCNCERCQEARGENQL